MATAINPTTTQAIQSANLRLFGDPALGLEEIIILVLLHASYMHVTLDKRRSFCGEPTRPGQKQMDASGGQL
jgi:hypothetical protein